MWRGLWLITLCLALEGLARYRYDLQNIWLPMSLRDNLAPTALASHRLVPNYVGQSRSGLDFYTDAFGFRCSQAQAIGGDWIEYEYQRVILAGDSIAFGMYENFEDSLGFHLQTFLPRHQVRVQALPGGSQAMTRDHLFGPDALALKSGANLLLHSITNYDNTDNWLYELDQVDYNKGFTAKFRELKYRSCPYFVQMLQVKLRAFLSKDRRKDLLWADEPAPQRTGASARAVEGLLRECQSHNIQLALFFAPDRGELLSGGTSHTLPLPQSGNSQTQHLFQSENSHSQPLQSGTSNTLPFQSGTSHSQPSQSGTSYTQALAEMCRDGQIPFFDLLTALRSDPTIDLQKIFRDDNIHLSAYGAKVVGAKLAQWVMELEP